MADRASDATPRHITLPIIPCRMSTESFNLFSMARNKLHSAVGGKDTCSLHRWVLLKNSIFRFQQPSAMPGPSRPNTVCSEHDEVNDEDENEADETDSFMFPDASKLVLHSGSEAEWLDSLLESLCDGGGHQCGSDDVRDVAGEDDDDSPLSSPMSSSDDLLTHHAYYSPPTPSSYPVPYPPFHPPLVRPCELGPIIESPAISPPSSAYDALPYYDIDELDDLSVPEAIEDVSDDESDVLSTPSLCRSSELFFVDPTAVPLPGRRLRRSLPHVYIRSMDSHLDRYELDPLPFPDEDNFSSYNHVYQEC